MSPAIEKLSRRLEIAGSRQLFSAFLPAPTGPGPGGNPCLLYSLDRAPEHAPSQTSTQTRCQSWPATHAGQAVIAVTCFTAGGRPIECCGHGLLTAAHSWLQRLDRNELTLRMDNSLVRARRDGTGTTWLRFPRLPVRRCSVPRWTAKVFPVQAQPVAAARCGDARGYLVLQWPDESALGDLLPALSALCKHTQRALICTAAHPSAGEGAVQLRYFAPQYGVDEDPATGSAMRVLAAYWADSHTRLQARQCSPEGGLLLSLCGETHVEVGGRCASLSESAAHA